MLTGVEQMIRQELINNTKSLVVTNDMGHAGPLFIFADEIRCMEAFDNCLRFISQNLTINQDSSFKSMFLTQEETTDTWTLLMENEHLRENSKTKLMGLMMKNNIEEFREFNSQQMKEMISISDQLINYKKRCNCN